VDGLSVELLWARASDGKTGKIDLSSPQNGSVGFEPTRIVVPLADASPGVRLIDLFTESEGTIYELNCVLGEDGNG